MDTISSMLTDNNLKVTSQRVAIIKILQNINTHPCPQTIYMKLKLSQPKVSFSTVYKNLKTLKENNLIQEVHAGQDYARYDINTSPHPHFVCSFCSSVYDIPGFDSIDNLKYEVAKKTNFTIMSQQLYFFGKCEDCLLIKEL
jgi:Fur family transcriptional regulator, peroxide stress response regulator